MVLTRDICPLLFFIFSISLQFPVLGLYIGSELSQSNDQECLALLQLAGNLNLSTNCNCTFLTKKEQNGLWMPCNERNRTTCGRHFAVCAGNFVHELHLGKLGLQGNLSWVANFKHLKLLDVSLNNLTGTLASSLWRLGELTHVNLSFNSFSGHISNFTNDSNSSTIPHLQVLDFSHNQITGHFPQNICTSLPNLTQLKINNNHLTGYANLSLCKRLESLDASFNRLQGPLLEELTASKSLKYINLKTNFMLNGSIPNLSGFSQLAYFDASFNNFSGTFGFDHNNFPLKLSRFNVSYNNLEVGFDASTIMSIGLSSFWPNRACRGCFPARVTLSPSPSPSSSLSMLVQKRSQVNLDTIIGISIGSVGALLFITIVSCVLIRKRRMTWPPHIHKRPAQPFKYVPESGPFSFESQSGPWIADIKDPSNVPVIIFKKPLLNLTFADLIQATKSFNREFEEGDGTGLVYACMLPGVLEDNAKVAIKVVEDGRSLSNEAAHAAFSAMGAVKHDNLVPLLGYCIVGEEKLLIHKHMEGGSLEDVLHAVPEGSPLLELKDAAMVEDQSWCTMEDGNQLSCGTDCTSMKPCLDWKSRHTIALGVARALAYLHNGYRRPIVHGAVSSSCIMLDALQANEAKLANYGGAWGLPRRLAPGYVAPECPQTAHMAAAVHSSLSLKCRESVQVVVAYPTKCDVYGMGVVLLELATGRRAVGNYGGASATLVAWIRELMKGKRAERAVDPKLRASPNLLQLSEMIKLGYLCTADSPSKRPSMQQVVGLLKDLDQ